MSPARRPRGRLVLSVVGLAALAWVALVSRPRALDAQPAPSTGLPQRPFASSDPSPTATPTATPTPATTAAPTPATAAELPAPTPATAPAPSPVAAPPAELTTIPTGKGLPVVVRAATYFADIDRVQENDGAFDATIDLRLRWADPRLAFPPADAPEGFVELEGPQAEARLGEIWSPDVAIANLVDEPSYQLRGLRLYPDGRVELMQRTTARFATAFDVERFPFDHQQLRLELVSRRDPITRVTLDYRQDDLDFSRLADDVAIDGWTAGLINIHREALLGWHGRTHARLWASLEILRQGTKTIASIFIPLLASLLIPLLALWLQRVEDGEVKIEAFELTNILIGGVFAVIALNFTVSDGFPMLAASDNTVTRLFGLNYLVLAVSLIINITVFRFGLVARWLGKYAQEQLFTYLVWALPVMVLGSAAAIILAAMA